VGRQSLAVLIVLLIGSGARGEDERQRRARQELEAQLDALVGQQPTRVRVDFVGLDEPNYKLEDVAFYLDDEPVTLSANKDLNSAGTHHIWTGDVPPGRHTLKSKLTVANAASVVVSEEGGYKWKVGGSVAFDLMSGIEVQVRVTPTRDASQSDIARRFKISMPAAPVMLAKLDDGKMPERVAPLPVNQTAVVVDAGAAAPDAVAEAKPPKTSANAQKPAQVVVASAKTRREPSGAPEALRPADSVPLAEPAPVVAPPPAALPEDAGAGAEVPPAVVEPPRPAPVRVELPVEPPKDEGGHMVWLVLALVVIGGAAFYFMRKRN
jgi:hypothetical protein